MRTTFLAAALLLLVAAVAYAVTPAATVDEVTTTSIKLGSLTCNTPYRFTVRTVNPDGTTSAAQTINKSTATCPAPPPGSGPPTNWRRFSSFETSLTANNDGFRCDAGSFTCSVSTAVGGTDGSSAAKITGPGDAGCSCSRVKFEDGFSIPAGGEVWFGGSFYLTANLAYTRLMNLGHYEGTSRDWYLGVESVGTAGHYQVGFAPYGDPHTSLVDLGQLALNQWVKIDIHAKLSQTDGQALTEAYVNGVLVGSSTAHNMYNDGPLHFYNAGLSYYWPGNGNTTTYFDAARLS